MLVLGVLGCRLRGCGLGEPAAWPAPAAPGPALCLGAWGPAGGECVCAVGGCCRVCGLVAALQRSGVMWGICLGYDVCAVLRGLWDCRLEPV